MEHVHPNDHWISSVVVRFRRAYSTQSAPPPPNRRRTNKLSSTYRPARPRASATGLIGCARGRASQLEVHVGMPDLSRAAGFGTQHVLHSPPARTLSPTNGILIHPVTVYFSTTTTVPTYLPRSRTKDSLAPGLISPGPVALRFRWITLPRACAGLPISMALGKVPWARTIECRGGGEEHAYRPGY